MGRLFVLAIAAFLSVQPIILTSIETREDLKKEHNLATRIDHGSYKAFDMVDSTCIASNKDWTGCGEDGSVFTRNEDGRWNKRREKSLDCANEKGNNNSPYIGHIAVTASHPDKPIEIKASIVDDTEVSEATIYYRVENGSGFNSVSMVETSTSIYIGIIPASDVTLGSKIEYYIEAKDYQGNIKYDPPQGPNKPYRINVTKVTWRPIGPYMGYAWTIAVDPKNPNILYVLGDYGVWKSINKGRTWQSINRGVTTGCFFTAIAVDPVTPTILYVAPVYAYTIGICKSEDGGNRWKRIGLYNWYVLGLTVSPSGTVFACVSEKPLRGADSRGGIYRSEDGGKNWGELIEVDDDKPAVTTLAVDPSSPNTLYAGTWGNGVYKSTDGGMNWLAINNGLEGYPCVIPKGITINPVHTNTVYLLAYNPDNKKSNIFRTRDGGITWESINSYLEFASPTRKGAQLVVDPKVPDTLYVGLWNGVFKSEDNGDSWFPINNLVEAEPLVPGYLFRFVTSVAIDPVDTNNIYASGAAGFFRSENSGVTWVQSNAGFHNIWSFSLELDPKNPGYIYICTGELRGYKTEDFGKSWKQMYRGLEFEGCGNNTLAHVDRIVIDPSTPTTVYAGLYGGPVGSYTGILCKSIDGGETWKRKTNGMPDKQKIHGLAIDPKDPSVIYAGVANQGIYKTTDGGENWKYCGLMDNFVWKIAVDPSNPEIVYAGVVEGDIGVYKSTTGGEQWTLILENKVVSDIAINPKDTDTIYVACANYGGLHKSTDGGKTWKQIPNEETDVFLTAVILDPKVPDIVYAELWRGMVDIFRSEDGGETWDLFITGIESVGPPSLKRGSIKVDPILPNTVYITTWGVGSYMCEVIPGKLDHYKVYAPKTATVHVPFELEIITLDEDSWVVTDYEGVACLYVNQGDIFPEKIYNFVNGTTSLNITLDTPGNITITVRDSANPGIYGTCTITVIDEDEKVNISINKPKKGYLYIFDKEIIPLKNTIIIGKVTVEVDAYSKNGIDKVEFYIDSVLKNTDSKEPYRWLWKEFAVGRHKITVVAYTSNGKVGIDEIEVFIFNP